MANLRDHTYLDYYNL